MNTIGMALILISCTLCGFAYDANEKKRVLQLDELFLGFNLLKSEIDYKLTPLIEALQEVASQTEQGVDRLFGLYSQKLNQRDEMDTKKMWKQTLMEANHWLRLKEEDLKLLESFGTMSSHFDREVQRNNITWLLESLKQRRDQANELYEKRSKLYRSMGVLIGLSIVIVLI
ncbi:stage III sporulation protein AB [Candidatus Epulonipiscium viviparus]|uniref:stage III sporulation protein AB n=1 Tax=Candidatus Epulonipiscium viviparus TaxID=420336 RepID=UPI00016BFB14|nr:stage III sporulation protein AB [Candidatus Epulopiscium viviparus]